MIQKHQNIKNKIQLKIENKSKYEFGAVQRNANLVDFENSYC